MDQSTNSLMYTSHDMDEDIQLCDRIIFLGSDRFYEHILIEKGKKVVAF